jgi:dihydrofolate reductase
VGRLVYSAIASLDGYVADAGGSFAWAAPDSEVHAFANELERPIGTHLFGRRMYEVMAVWDTLDDEAPEMRDFAELWRATDKVVYSRTLSEVSTARTRLEREFDPDAVLRMKGEAEADISVGGPGLAEAALRAGLVDELHLIAVPVVVGGGTHWLPRDIRLDLELLDERRFAGGAVYLRHRVDLGAARSSLG